MAAHFRFGSRSEQNLVGVHPDVVRIARLALLISAIDFGVTEGVRSIERQRQLYAQGRTAPGKIVTWTMQSKHLKQSDGYSHAVDLVPVNPVTEKLDFDYAAGFEEISAAMFAAADYLGEEIRWGRDWDRDGIAGEKGEYDGPHFELVETSRV